MTQSLSQLYTSKNWKDSRVYRDAQNLVGHVKLNPERRDRTLAKLFESDLYSMVALYFHHMNPKVSFNYRLRFGVDRNKNRITTYIIFNKNVYMICNRFRFTIPASELGYYH